MAVGLLQVVPSHAAAGDVLTLIGEDFAGTDHVFFRRHGATEWQEVNPSRVELDGADLVVTIDEANTDGWPAGLCDVGVAATGEPVPTAPTSWLAQAVFFYVARPYDPNAVIKGAPKALYIDGEFVGHLHGAVEVEHNVETSDVEVNESLMPIRSIKAGETMVVSAPMAEVTLENLRRVWGVAAEVEDLGGGRRRLRFGGDTELREVPVLLVTPAGSGMEWAITFYRCTVTTGGTLTWSRDEQVDLPLRITVLADTSRPVGDQILRVEEYPTEAAEEEPEA